MIYDYSTVLLYQVRLIFSSQNSTATITVFVFEELPLVLWCDIVRKTSSTFASTRLSSSEDSIQGNVTPQTCCVLGWIVPNARWNKIARRIAPITDLATERSHVCRAKWD